jgi:hypothetical protein
MKRAEVKQSRNTPAETPARNEWVEVGFLYGETEAVME